MSSSMNRQKSGLSVRVVMATRIPMFSAGNGAGASNNFVSVAAWPVLICTFPQDLSRSFLEIA